MGGECHIDELDIDGLLDKRERRETTTVSEAGAVV
jgi:hypothetical protein